MNTEKNKKIKKNILVTGGCRSGKSDFALQLAEQIPGQRLFIATCPCTDTEMTDRIGKHRETRANAGWQTIEEELAVAAIIKDAAPGLTIVVDCLTLWISNLLFDADNRGEALTEQEVGILAQGLAEAARKHEGMVIMVTGEVGQGIVPDNTLARRYRDLVGRCNRIVAAVADQVFMVSCGIPVQLK